VYGVDGVAAESFAQLLAREQPDIVHQHAVTAACSHDLIARAHARGLPAVFTYHTPAVTCLRGTLLHNGRDRCDGHLEVDRCTPCTLEGLGVNPRLVRTLDGVPAAIGQVASRLNLAGGMFTALRMRELVTRRHAVAQGVLDRADVIVSLTPWVTDLLRLNGVPDAKIVESAHGIEHAATLPDTPRLGPFDRVRVAHLGRVDPVKGTLVLIEAMRAVPDAALALDVFGVVQSESSRRLLDELRTRADRDARIHFRPSLAPADVIARLADYDLVAVPSQWMETGPLVVLEAFAAGVPVLGSDLGGIADKVRDGIDGMLVRPYHSAAAWADALRTCAADPQRVDRLRAGVRPPRSIAAVAGDMERVYRALTATPPPESRAVETTA
jgi:glycosyltransferase involved in cell wall biosynthesis